MSSEPMTYIAIKNWEKYQADKNGKLRDIGSPWIKDYTDKESDYDYSQLTMVQRYVYDALRRLRGKLGSNPPFDAVWLCRKLDIGRTERGAFHKALLVLRELKLIEMVTTQEDLYPTFVAASARTIPKNGRRDYESTPNSMLRPQGPSDESSVDSATSDSNNRVEKNKSKSRVEASSPRSLSKQNQNQTPEAFSWDAWDSWAEPIDDLTVEQVQAVLKYWAEAKDDFWRRAVHSDKSLRKNIHKMLAAAPKAKPVVPILQANPDCPECFGSGFVTFFIPGSVGQKQKDCGCLHT